MSIAYQDGQLIRLAPNCLKDMHSGGNTRRKVREGWAEFVESIKTQGVLQSVVARIMPDGSFELLAGYGRRDAAIEAGIADIPVMLRIVDDTQALEINLTENTARAALNFSDQVVWAKRFMSLYKGDVASAAQRLGWPETKLRERLALLPCVESVLDALDAGQINVKHALILAAFDGVVQENTLKKVIAEKWSVQELKAKAERVQLPLSRAIFSQNDCLSCPHNTELQSGLFGMGESALCSKSSCYHEKTKQALAIRKTEAEERYGTVLWLSQSVPEHRVTVTPAVVGEQQYNSGCLGCDKRIAVMDDSPAGSPGSILESQCSDKTCFHQCVSAFDTQKNTPPATTPDVDAADNQDSNQNVTTIGSAKKASVKSVQTSNSPSVVESHWDELRKSAAQYLQGDQKLPLVLQLMGLMELTKFKSVGDPTKSIGTLLNHDEATLQAMIDEVVLHALNKAAQINGYDSRKILTKAAMSTGGEQALIAAWTPTPEGLDKYTVQGLEQLVRAAGLFDLLESQAAGAGKKLLSGKKSVVIENILKANFDWTNFAPPAYLENMGMNITQQAAA